MARTLDGFTIKPQELNGYGLHILFLFDNQQLVVRQQEIRGMVIPLILVIILTVILGA